MLHFPKRSQVDQLNTIHLVRKHLDLLNFIRLSFRIIFFSDKNTKIKQVSNNSKYLGLDLIHREIYKFLYEINIQ